MTANPYVAEVQGPSWHAGTFLIDDVMSLSEDINSGDWLAAGMDAVAGVIDTVATVSDPLGSAIAAGIGFILEHLEPLKGWLNDLTGDPYQVQANAGTYANVAKGLAEEADVLNRSVAKDFEDQSGQLVAAYVARMGDISNGLIALSNSANATSGALGIAATIVQVVHDMVRDAISEIIGSAISYAAELVLTLGAATPLVIEQVSTRVASISARIGKNVTGVVTSVRNLGDLVKRLDDALGSLADQFRKLDFSGGKGGPGTKPHGPESPTTRRPLDDLSDIDFSDAPPPPQGLYRAPDDPELLQWVDDMHAKYPGLSKEEIHGMWDYTTDPGYDAMNGALRDPASMTPDVQARIDNAVSGLDRLPHHDGVTYRGTNLPDHVVDEINRTGVYSDPAFSSSSSNRSVSEGFVNPTRSNPTVMTINGHSSTDVRPFSAAQGEAEYLFRPGVKFDVVSNTVVPEMMVNGQMMQNVRVLELREPR